MEFTKTEIEILIKTVVEANTSDTALLDELQLALVGGGTTDVTFC